MTSETPTTMRAMVLHHADQPLRLERLPLPHAGPGQVQLRVEACGVCRTDLHLLDGELAEAPLPIVPGHEIVGRVSALGEGTHGFHLGQRVGVPWLGWSCGSCRFCSQERENLCPSARFTGSENPSGREADDGGRAAGAGEGATGRRRRTN